MIDPALLFLIRLRWRAMLRKTVRGAKSRRGIVMFILGMLLVVLWIAPAVFLAMRGEKGDVQQFSAFVPLGLLGMCMLSLMTSTGERAIYFSPGEVEFLFPGPFGRREVLAYKLLGTVLNVMIGALIFSVMALRFTSTWIAAYVGVVLSLVFIQYFTMAALLVSESFSQRAYTRGRKLLVYAVGVIVAAAAGRVLAARGEAGRESFVVLLRESPWLGYVLAPFEPFARVMTANAVFPDMLLWAGVCVAMNAVLFAIIVLIDAEYRETAIRVSQRIYTRMQRAQRSGMAQTNVTAGGRRVPHLPWLAGAGPIVWRQCTNVVRNGRSVLLMMVLLSVAIGVPAMRGAEEHKNLLLLSIGMFAWLTILLSMMVRFDFRTDIEQMDWLKVLPIASTSLAVGQLTVPTLLCTVMQTLLAALAAYFMKMPEIVPIALAFGLPTNLMLFGIENTMFLLMPTRTAAFSPGDFQVFGRQLLFMLVKGIFISIAWVIAFFAGAAVSLLLGDNRIVGAAVGWVVLMTFAIATVPCVAWAFRRHDVSLDTPA
ncbi:MAG: hypothetical protein HUU46_03000 [Candidatus Hydrogenedentes bacterium]|nr:hypothetical protein [Candidatus Hydrogenedentota bacterium]